MTADILEIPAANEDSDKELAQLCADRLKERIGQINGWVGVRWDRRRKEWMIGNCFYDYDRDKALRWYDNGWGTPVRLYRVTAGTAVLRCSKLALFSSFPPNQYRDPG